MVPIDRHEPAESGLHASRRSPALPAALTLLLLFALGVRVAGVGSDLPFVYHWDEPTPVNLAVWIHEEGSLDPQFFHYPGGLSYLLASEYAAVRFGGRAIGAFESDAEAREWLEAGTPPRPPGGGVAYTFPTEGVPLLYVLGRWSVAILGTLTVYWVFHLGSLIGGKSVGWLAAALLALSAFHARHSSLVTVDVPCAAFLTWFLLELLRGRSWIRAGVALGLAAAFKYTGGIGIYAWPLGVAVLASRARPIWPTPTASPTASASPSPSPSGSPALPLSQALSPSPSPSPSDSLSPAPDEEPGTPASPSVLAQIREWNLFWLRLGPVAAAVFLALNPFALLSPGRFFHDLAYEALHMREGTGHFEADVGVSEGGLHVIADTLVRSMGPLLLIGLAVACAVGVVGLFAARHGFLDGFLASWGRKPDAARSTPRVAVTPSLAGATPPAAVTPSAAGNSPRVAVTSSLAGAAPPAAVTPSVVGVTLLVLFCSAYLVQLASWSTVYDRYLLPLWPPLIVLTAVGWSGLLAVVGRGRRSVMWIGAIALAASVVPGLVPSVRARLSPDPRVQMTRWIDEHVDPTATVTTEPSGPPIDASERTVFRVDLLGRRSLGELQRDGVHFLVSTGREDMLPASAPESLRTRKETLLADCQEVWRSGKYAVYSVPTGDSVVPDAQRAVQDERFSDALTLTAAGLARDADNGVLWMLRGQALEALGDPTAVDAYVRASELRPKDGAPLYALGNLELAARRWQRAFTTFAEAGRRAPEDPIALLNQSTALGYWAADLAVSDSLERAREVMADALVRARAAAVMAPRDEEFAAQEVRLRHLADQLGIAIE